MGGFANQLFQYAFYLKLIETYNEKNVFADISHYKTCKDHGGFKLNRFVKLNYCNINRTKKYITITENEYDHTTFENTQTYLFYGYWQAKKYFPDDLTKIKSIFNVKNLSSNNLEYLNQIESSESVSIHIRRGDYVNNFMHGNIANKEYFENSIEYMTNRLDSPVFFVFSDDINWCKTSIDFKGNKVIYIIGNSDKIEQDIILMSSCKHNIISNSSFSWWAQNLNSNTGKIVIAPEYWFNQKTESVSELVVENGIKIKNIKHNENFNEKPFFSIIVPVYNTSSTLRRTLVSILNQSFYNIEVIIINDASTDDSFDIITDYSLYDKRIRLINNEINSSVYLSRLKGVENAVGKYILFIDSDDWFELDACEILHNKLKESDVEVLEFGYIKEPSKQKSCICKTYTTEDILNEKINFTIWNKAYKREFLLNFSKKLPSFYCNYAEDAFFSLLSSYYCKSFDYTENYLSHYSEGTGISTQKIKSTEKVIRICTDVTTISKNLKDFFSNKSDKYCLQIDNFILRRYDNILYHIDDDDDLYNTLMNFDVADKILKTDFSLKKIKQIQNKVNTYNYMAKSSILSKIKFIIKYFLRSYKNRNR